MTVQSIAGIDVSDSVAVIDEVQCIGCVKCIHACPFDAIIGAARQLHTVIADLCTGCLRCLEPCPVDCIRMLPVQSASRLTRNWREQARRRHTARSERLQREGGTEAVQTGALAERRAYNIAAIERVRQKRGLTAGNSAVPLSEPAVASRAPAGITPRQVKFLRGLAHDLEPSVWIGQHGLTTAVRDEIEAALTHHELVKIRIRAGERREKDRIIAEITALPGIIMVQRIGNIAVFYRRHPERPQIPLP